MKISLLLKTTVGGLVFSTVAMAAAQPYPLPARLRAQQGGGFYYPSPPVLNGGHQRPAVSGGYFRDLDPSELLPMNREGQVAASCVREHGIVHGAACTVARLTHDELRKCFTDGIGGRGCFGDNNTFVSIVRNNFEAAQRERNDGARLVRGAIGVSIRDIEERGWCGGDNSEARKLFGSLCR